MSERRIDLSRNQTVCRLYEHWIFVHINCFRATAVPDNGSALNIFSKDFVKRNKLLIDDSEAITIYLPNGAVKQGLAMCQSSVSFPW